MRYDLTNLKKELVECHVDRFKLGKVFIMRIVAILPPMCSCFTVIRGGQGRAGMTRDDVIVERDSFRQSRGLLSGNYFLTITNLVAFLRELGLPGYTAIPYRATPRFPDTLHETQEMIFHEAPM